MISGAKLRILLGMNPIPAGSGKESTSRTKQEYF